MKKILNLISYSFILLYLYAAASKLMGFQEFKVQLGQSPVLTGCAGIVVWLIPAVEIAIAVLLVFQRTLLVGLYAAFGLMLMFIGYILVILYSGEQIPCNCGGLLDAMSWTQHLVFNSVFAVLGLIGIILYNVFMNQEKLNNCKT